MSATAESELDYSIFRKAQAQRFGDLAAVHSSPKYFDSTGPKLCIGIASVSRREFSYLNEALGSVLEGLDGAERRCMYLVHEAFRQPWLLNMVDRLPTYPDDPDILNLVWRIEGGGGYEAHARMQKVDYTALMSECAKVSPEYTMTLEDNVFASDGRYNQLLNALRTAAKKTEELGREVSKALMPPILFVLRGVCTPMLIGLFFAAGRNCMLPKAPGVHLMQNYSCCAQGLVFSQSQVHSQLLPLYRGTHDSHAAAVMPVLIQHVGGKSSHGAGDQESGLLTDDMSFDHSFETNNPVGLAKEHHAWITEIR
ncbi:integral membrane protein [Hypoxylon sp. FL1284]|nr:integral membrane protein [Hypoxylon sp. FL1284]